jgi:hypothetical protein
MLERGPWVSGETVTRNIYVLDVESGSAHDSVSLFVYTKRDFVSATDDTVTVTLSRTISLPLVGGSGVHASMAANDSYLYVGTNKGTQAASVRPGTWTVTPIGGFSPPIPVASISSDSYGYITVTFGAPGGTFSGFYVFGPTGVAEHGANLGRCGGDQVRISARLNQSERPRAESGPWISACGAEANVGALRSARRLRQRRPARFRVSHSAPKGAKRILSTPGGAECPSRCMTYPFRSSH